MTHDERSEVTAIHYCTCPNPLANLTETPYYNIDLEGPDPTVPPYYINADHRVQLQCPTCTGYIRENLDFLAHWWHVPHTGVLARLAAPRTEWDKHVDRMIQADMAAKAQERQK